MKCLVPVKRVVDFSVKIHVKKDESGVDMEHVKMSMNPFDEIALEEALRLQESGKISEFIAVSIGNKSSEETLRTALARGAEKAILIDTKEALELDPLIIAKLLKEIVLQEKINLVLMGKQAIDDDCNQTGQMLAGLLNWPQGTFASHLDFNMTEKTVEITREIDGGHEVLRLRLPAVITTDLRLNEPRYISLPNVMKAKAKPLTTVLAQDLLADLTPHVTTIKVSSPAERKPGMLVHSAKDLVEKLHHEAKVI